MLTTNITLAEKYDYLSDKFKKAFTFLLSHEVAIGIKAIPRIQSPFAQNTPNETFFTVLNKL